VNRFAEATSEEALLPCDGLERPILTGWMDMTQEEFSRRY
jgi:epoxyqueuosine reductase QueG